MVIPIKARRFDRAPRIDVAAARLTAGQQADASKLFENNCAKCHGKDGHAETFRGKLVGARNLADAKWQEKTTDEQIVAAIKKGPGAMPSFEKKSSQEQIASLVAYVRHFKAEDGKPEEK